MSKKIAFLFGAWSCAARPLDFNCLWSSPRALTGSDLGITETAKYFAKKGHDVSLFTVYANDQQPETWEGVKLRKIENKGSEITEDFDAIISWSEPDILRDLPKKPIKVVCQMLNDFNYCQPSFDDVVDIWTAPCQKLIDHLMTFSNAPSRDKFFVVPLGCDRSWYKETKRVPGRVIWTSSPDRGLHWLLSEWKNIKKAVPEAHLKIFYNFNYDHIKQIEFNDPNTNDSVKEMANRARYCLAMIQKLKPLGVEHCNSISRNQMANELNEAMVLAYSCDPVLFSEGFSISILESCAAGVLPVITDVDCLGSIYSGTVPMVKSPIEQNLKEFSEIVIKGLTNEKWRNQVINKCKIFANKYSWENVSSQLEDVVLNFQRSE